MKRRHEEIAKAEFSALVEMLFPGAAIAWEEVQPSDEPPDWYLSIDGARYAVEATSVFEQIETKSGLLPSISVSATLHRFIDDVEATAIKEGILTGAYAVALCPIANFPEVKPQIKQALLEYIRSTRGAASAPRKGVAKIGHRTISIQKFHSKKKYVAEVISYDGKWEGEAQEEIFTLLTRIIDDKAIKLSAVPDPLILLILDAYNYANSIHWRNAISAYSSRARFECICRIAPIGHASVMYARHPKWLSR